VIGVAIEKPRGVDGVRSKLADVFTDRRTQFPDSFGKRAIFESEEYRRRRAQNAGGPEGISAAPRPDIGRKHTGNRKVLTLSSDKSTQLPPVIAQQGRCRPASDDLVVGVRSQHQDALVHGYRDEGASPRVRLDGLEDLQADRRHQWSQAMHQAIELPMGGLNASGPGGHARPYIDTTKVSMERTVTRERFGKVYVQSIYCERST
jgi:hypothetical protein